MNSRQHISITLAISGRPYQMLDACVCLISLRDVSECGVLRKVGAWRRPSRNIVVEFVEHGTAHRSSRKVSPAPALESPGSRQIPVLTHSLRNSDVKIVPSVASRKELQPIVQHHAGTVKQSQRF